MTLDYAGIHARLSPESIEVLHEMVALHLEAGTGDRRFVPVSTQGRPLGYSFVAVGNRNFGQRSLDIPTGAIADLVELGIVRERQSGSRSEFQQVSGTTLDFYRWLVEQEGKSLDQVESSTIRVLQGSEFAREHRSASAHLSDAFRELWTDELSNKAISVIGDNLRKALMDVTTDLVGEDASGRQEYPTERLRSKLKELGRAEREVEVLSRLVEFADATLKLDHRLNHVRDESDKGSSPVTPGEVRRAAFVTAFVCAELSRALRA